MTSHSLHTNTDLSKPHSFTTSSSEYTLLMNRFKLLNLVQRIAHRDVLAMIETIGLDGLHYKCTTKQPWMMDWNMNADDHNVVKEGRKKGNVDKLGKKQASKLNNEKMEKQIGNMERNLPQQTASKTHTNVKRNTNTSHTLMHQRHHKTFHDRNVDKINNEVVTLSSSPRLTEGEINKLVQRLAQPRESYTIDMDETSFTTEEDVFGEENANFVEKINDNISKINRDQEADKSRFAMSNVQPVASSMTPQEPSWKQLQMATGLMESAPLPLHTHKHKSKWDKEKNDKEKTLATTTATTDSVDNVTLTSSPRPRSRTWKQSEEELQENIVNNEDNINDTNINKKEENTMRATLLNLQEVKVSQDETASTLAQERQEPEEQHHLQHHLETNWHEGNIENASAQISNKNNVNSKVNTLPITPTRAIAPKAKPIAVHNTERVPINIIQHAAALVARQREQRQIELSKRQLQIQQEQQERQQQEENKNVEQLASTQRYLPTQSSTVIKNKFEKLEQQEKQEQEIPQIARSYSVAHGHDADKLFDSSHFNTSDKNNETQGKETTLPNKPTDMERNTVTEVTTTPMLPRATFADQRTLAKLSDTIDHMLRDHEHILHEVIADHDKTQEMKYETENERHKEKSAAMLKLNKEKEKEKKHVKSSQGRHLHRFSAFATDNSSRNGKHLQSSSRASSSTSSESLTCSSLSSRLGEDTVNLNLPKNNKPVIKEYRNNMKRPSKRTSTGTITSTATTTTATSTTSSSADKHNDDDDELLMLSRMQRTFAKMNNETHDIIARTSQARVPAIGHTDLLQSSNVNVNSTNKLHQSKIGQLTSSASLPLKAISHRRRGQMPEVAVRRLNAYRVENLEHIAREERRWNTSNISQFTFACRLTNALFEDCFDEVMSEVNSIMDNYVDGLAEHEMA